MVGFQILINMINFYFFQVQQPIKQLFTYVWLETSIHIENSNLAKQDWTIYHIQLYHHVK